MAADLSVKFKQSEDGDLSLIFDFPSDLLGFQVCRSTDHHYYDPDAQAWNSNQKKILFPESSGAAPRYIFECPPAMRQSMAGSPLAYQFEVFGKDGKSLAKGRTTPDKPIFIPNDFVFPKTPLVRPEDGVKPEDLVVKPEPAKGSPVAGPSSGPDKKQAKQWPPYVWAAALAGAVAAGVSAYFFWPSDKGKVDSAQTTTEAKAEKSRRLSARERAREFFSDPQRSAPEAMKLAAELKPESKEDEDTLYRLYYFGAQKGESLALKPYGEFLDPSLPAKGTIKKDAPEAWQAYGQVQDAAAQSRLKTWLEQNQLQNPQAQRWLQEIEKREKK